MTPAIMRNTNDWWLVSVLPAVKAFSQIAVPPTQRNVALDSRAFLARNGQAEGAIVIGKESGRFYRWRAEEIQAHRKKLSHADLPIVTEAERPTGKSLIVLGGPKANPLTAAAQQQGIGRF